MGKVRQMMRSKLMLALLCSFGIFLFQEQGRSDENTSAWPSCVDLSQKYCEDLKKNSFVTLFDGEVDYRDTYKGNEFRLSRATEDFLRLKASRMHFFPKDYQKKMGPLTKQIDQLLKKTKKTPLSEDRLLKFEWSQLLEKNNFLLNQLARDRLYRRLPKLKSLDPLLWTMDDKMQLQKEGWKLSNETFVITYMDSSYWKRIQNVFSTAKIFLKEAIQESNFEPMYKERMIHQIETIALAFPDDETLESSGFHECGSSGIKNAIYSRASHQLIICLGTMIAFRSESALFFLLAHELGHAIDSGSPVFRHLSANDQLFEKIALVSHENGLSCQDFEKVQRDMKKELADTSYQFPPINQMEKLSECLDSRVTSLRKNLSEAVWNSEIDQHFDQYKKYHHRKFYFTQIESPTIEIDNRIVENISYGNLLTWIHKPGIQGRTNISLLNIYMQRRNCRTDQEKSMAAEDWLQLGSEDSLKLLKLYYQRLVRVCGPFCQEFSDLSFYINTKELIADWWASKVFEKYLKTLKNLENQRQAALASMSLFCSFYGGFEPVSPKLVAKEIQLSQAGHPDDQTRKLVIFTPAIQKILHCRGDGIPESVGRCQDQNAKDQDLAKTYSPRLEPKKDL